MKTFSRPLQAVSAIIAIFVMVACGGSEEAPIGEQGGEESTATAADEDAQPGESATDAEAPATEEAEAVHELRSVTLMLDYLPGPGHFGFAAALANGYYEEEGIALEQVIPGRASGITAQLVASGAETFGFADGGAVAAAVSAGAPIKVVAGLFQTGANGIGFLCDAGIEEPEDLRGLRVAGPAGAPAWEGLAAAFEEVGMSLDDIEQLFVAPAAKIPTLLSGDADAMTTTVYDLRHFRQAPEIGREGCQVGLPEWGVEIMGSGLIARNETIAQDPELVSGFVRATLRGFQAAVDDPVAAREALLERFDVENDPIDLDEGWTYIVPMFHTAATQDRPFGWMAESDWEYTLEILDGAGALVQVLPAEEYFTNEFIPEE